jgi:propionyl-CoA synthetase
MSCYHDVYAAWKEAPEAFWAEAALNVAWYKIWDKVYDPCAGQYGRWFVGAECNTAYNCLDRHVENGRAQQKALIYDSPVTKTTRSYTYAELTEEVAALAGVLLDLGVRKCDRVIIYLPMIPEAVMAMLACARIGAVHSVVFGGFAPAELATRITDARPVAILSASCAIEGAKVVSYKPLLDKAIELADYKPASVLILQRPMAEAPMVAGRDHDWASTVASVKAHGRRAGCASLKATDPLYILYTSGTTGQPKGVVRDNGGHMVALKWTMKNHYGVEPGEVFWAASDVGWIVGHSYICYAPLLHGATTVVYEGKPVGTPDAGAFWRVIAQHNVAALFTAPTAFRAIKKEDPNGQLIKNYDLNGFRTLFLAGERADPATVKWAEAHLKAAVIDHWWQTETGWVICGNPVGLGQLPVKYGSATVPMPGFDVQALDGAGKQVSAGQPGTLAIKLPLPPGCLPTLWDNDDRRRRLPRRRRIRLRDGAHRRRH